MYGFILQSILPFIDLFFYVTLLSAIVYRQVILPPSFIFNRLFYATLVINRIRIHFHVSMIGCSAYKTGKAV